MKRFDTKPNEVIFALDKSDLESAVRMFICACHPDVKTQYVIDLANKDSQVLFGDDILFRAERIVT